MRQFQIGQNDGGQRLDKFVFKTVKSMPSSLLYKYLRLKKIKVNGKRAEGGTMLSPGDTVSFFIPDTFFEESGEKESLREDLLRVRVRLSVVYEDEHLLIVDKEEGMLCHTGDETEEHSDDFSVRSSLLYQIWAYLCQKGEYDPGKELSFSPALCHRLDRNTGGLVVAAKTAEALREMNALIRDGELEKHYLCAVHGRLEKKSDKLTGYLEKDGERKTVTVYDHPGKGRREIRTEYREIRYSSRYDLSLLDVHLLTGRTH
ncbi:MAG: RluA family pseudouridine synthase, partial [Clostridia bacterium]|nr:RluA family pseudouridine synthase [Clostridia bacterium]